MEKGRRASDESAGVKATGTTLLRTNPLVFQCKECRTILGDSFSWAGANKTLKTLALSQVSESVIVEEEMEKGPMVGGGLTTETGGLGGGKATRPSSDESTYQRLTCSYCEADLGRFFHLCPEPYDDLVRAYTIKLSAIITYQVGLHAEPLPKSAAADGGEPAGQETADDDERRESRRERQENHALNASGKVEKIAPASEEAAAQITATVSEALDELEKQKETVSKLQSVMLIMSERLSRVEEKTSHLHLGRKADHLQPLRAPRPGSVDPGLTRSKSPLASGQRRRPQDAMDGRASESDSRSAVSMAKKQRIDFNQVQYDGQRRS